MKIFLAAAVAAASVVGPAIAGPNDLPAGPAAQKRAAPGDLGMAIMSAVINADGTAARGEGLVSATKLGTGQYETIFGRDITACAYSPALGLTGSSGSSPAGEIAVVGRAGTPSGLFMQTFDSTGAAADRSYHVIVYCGR